MTEEFIGPQALSLRSRHPNNTRSKELSDSCLPILGIDPGGTTGWSLLVLRANVLGREVFSHPLELILRSKLRWVHGEIDCRDEDLGVFQLRKVIDEWESAAIVMESFFLRQNRRESNRELLSPVRITAKIEHHLWLRGRKMFEQQPSLAKRLTNERLKELGVYTPSGGLEHARDADRHVLMFVRRCMEHNSKLKAQAWQHIYKEGSTNGHNSLHGRAKGSTQGSVSHTVSESPCVP